MPRKNVRRRMRESLERHEETAARRRAKAEIRAASARQTQMAHMRTIGESYAHMQREMQRAQRFASAQQMLGGAQTIVDGAEQRDTVYRQLEWRKQFAMLEVRDARSRAAAKRMTMAAPPTAPASTAPVLQATETEVLPPPQGSVADPEPLPFCPIPRSVMEDANAGVFDAQPSAPVSAEALCRDHSMMDVGALWDILGGEDTPRAQRYQMCNRFWHPDMLDVHYSVREVEQSRLGSVARGTVMFAGGIITFGTYAPVLLSSSAEVGLLEQSTAYILAAMGADEIVTGLETVYHHADQRLHGVDMLMELGLSEQQASLLYMTSPAMPAAGAGTLRMARQGVRAGQLRMAQTIDRVRRMEDAQRLRQFRQSTLPVRRDNYVTTDPRVLPDDKAKTFLGSRYQTLVTEKPVTLYRVGDSGRWSGEFWSIRRPRGRLPSIMEKALGQRLHYTDRYRFWNTAEKVYKVEIPAGEILHAGKVAPQGGFLSGGAEQVVIESPWLNSEIRHLSTRSLR